MKKLELIIIIGIFVLTAVTISLITQLLTNWQSDDWCYRTPLSQMEPKTYQACLGEWSKK